MDARDWDRRYADAALLWSATPNRFVAEELADAPPGNALDFAAGEGRNAVWLAERGWTVHAVDFSRVALDRGRRIAEERGVSIEWEEADLTRWEPPEGTYDLVLIAYLHLPWATMRLVLRSARQALAPGGTFLLVGHDRTNLTEGVGGPPDPAVLYGPEEVLGELAGLEIERADRVRRPVETEQGPREAVDVLVRAVRRCDR